MRVNVFFLLCCMVFAWLQKSRKEEDSKHVKCIAKLFEFTVCKVKRTYLEEHKEYLVCLDFVRFLCCWDICC